jgi:hypothetical protein
VKSQLGPLGTAATNRPIVLIPGDYDDGWMVEWWLAGETEVLGENLSQCRFVHHKPHMLCPDANLVRRGGKPATNRLNYGTKLTDLWGSYKRRKKERDKRA